MFNPGKYLSTYTFFFDLLNYYIVTDVLILNHPMHFRDRSISIILYECIFKIPLCIWFTTFQLRFLYQYLNNTGLQFWTCLSAVFIRILYQCDPELVRIVCKCSQQRSANYILWATCSPPRFSLDHIMLIKYCLATFTLQHRSWVAETETIRVWLIKPKILAFYRSLPIPTPELSKIV